MKDEIKFKSYMTALCELHDKTMSKLLTSLYWKVLEPFTDVECEEAFKELILSSKFFPKPADFIEILGRKNGDRAALAWISVVETVRRVGNYQSVQFADPIIHSVLEFLGGWSKTGEWKENELKWIEKEFVKYYGIMAAKKEHPAYLPGVLEIQNSANGYDSRSPRRIGFEDVRTKQIGLEYEL
jgi:hypothetical protein